MPTAIQLDWSSAEVKDARLSVGFSEPAPKKWRDVFARSAALLSNGTWELSGVKPRSVLLSPVHVGDEERVRHFLESAALEANAVLLGEDELFEAEPGSAGEGNGGAAPERSEDEESTARFRSFG